MCVSSLPKATLESEVAVSFTRDLLITSLVPYHYATKPHRVGKYYVTHACPYSVHVTTQPCFDRSHIMLCLIYNLTVITK